MRETEQRLVIGSLLHDFGKLLYRYNDGRNHSTSGYEYLKNIKMLSNEKDILDCVRFHHSGMLKNANIENNALCYITYIADNIAAAVDRREKEVENGGFIREVPYESIFNILNGNSENYVYKPLTMPVDDINYPINNDENNIIFNEDFYRKVIDNIENSLKGISISDKYINSLLQILEANLINIPSSTNIKELVDISLYDHLKLTAAFALSIKHYLDENNIYDYKEILFKKSEDFYNKNVFMIYSIDLSGIQNFIYNISSKSALKGLRARSFYLEILLESSIDELLSRAELCRANVLYTGGGHTYIIMPNTEKVKSIILDFEKELNMWLLENFDIGLFAAGGYAICSANDLKNKPEGSYKNIFTDVSKNISHKKLHRYSSSDILKLNSINKKIYSSECSICHRIDILNKYDECSICSSLKNVSDMIINKNDCFFCNY
ncbi:MAG: type III-A CRISPR-associated protein Cas10/Csm1 [Lachnospirales bacterium]